MTVLPEWDWCLRLISRGQQIYEQKLTVSTLKLFILLSAVGWCYVPQRINYSLPLHGKSPTDSYPSAWFNFLWRRGLHWLLFPTRSGNHQCHCAALCWSKWLWGNWHIPPWVVGELGVGHLYLDGLLTLKDMLMLVVSTGRAWMHFYVFVVLRCLYLSVCESVWIIHPLITYLWLFCTFQIGDQKLTYTNYRKTGA